MAATAPSFSYAEAAKGRSPSLVAEAPSKAENSEPVTDMTLPTNAPGTNEELSKSVESLKESSTGGPESLTSEVSKPAGDAQQANTQAAAPTSQLETGSTGTEAQMSSATSNSGTLPTGAKDIAGTATPNDSESGWDKVSQLSHSDEKQSTKGDGWETEDVKMSSWEHVSASAGLKEAAPPPVNPWQKRAADAQAKAKEGRSTSGNILSAAVVEPSQAKKTPEGGVGSGKTDDKPKVEDKAGLGITKAVSKPNDGKPRTDEGSRATEAAKPPAVSAPPPPNDAFSWPTPKLADQEEKRKAQDQGERAEKEKTPSKPHGKEKWEKVPFVPTAVFNTPIPPTARRGGRGGARGAREGGRGGYPGPSGERSVSGNGENTTTSGAQLPDRTRGNMGPPPPPRGGAAGSRGPKRSASAGPPMSRESRKEGDAAPERRDDGSHRNFSATPRYFPNENRRTSTSTQTDNGMNQRQTSPTRRHPSGADRDGAPSSGFQDQGHPRGNFDRRHDSFSKPQDVSREQPFIPNRERGDSRSERGRGGYRGGRNGHPNPNNQFHQVNGPNGAPQPHAVAPTKSQSYNESRQGPPSGAPAYGQQREPRHHRSGSRSQSIPNQPPFQRFPSNTSSAGPQHLTNLQTDMANMYGYPHPNQPMVMSAVQYHPYMEQLQMQGMLLMQMEYYFSVDNLCKDMFLRKHMDSQGYVLLSVIANFNRIKQLTRDVDFIRHTAAGSQAVELVVGSDGKDRVRKREDWQQWVLGMEDRLPQAQNDGPSHTHPPHFASHAVPNYMQPPTMNSAPPVSPRGSFNGGQRRPEPLMVNGNGSPPPTMADTKLTQTPLSAAVPDFTPSIPQPSSFQPANNVGDAENVFSDEQVKNLVIGVRKSNNGAGSPRVTMPEANRPKHSPEAKPLSPGQAESANRAGSDRTSPVIVNGDRASEPNGHPQPPRVFSPFSLGGSSRPHAAPTTPMYWVKDTDAPTENLPQELTHEAYTVFRAGALEQRAKATPGTPCGHDMDILYQFWSHFLVRNFNARMYAEFRALALEDARNPRNSPVGQRNLIAFLYEAILGPRTVPDGVARDFVDMVRAEKGVAERPAFDRLRAAWRNGAFNLKNRVKIDRIIGSELKSELER